MKEIPLKLPAPTLKGKVSVEEAIAKRRSIRKYKAEPLTLTQLSQILWSAQGITGSQQLRAAPSAGATYPLEIFILAGKETAEKLEAGVYHYDLATHSLVRQRYGDLRRELAKAALDQGFLATAPVDIVICALYQRTCHRYGRRGERYTHMEMGHVGENIHLQAVALGLGAVMIGAFNDEEVRRILNVQEQFRPLYIIPLGKPV